MKMKKLMTMVAVLSLMMTGCGESDENTVNFKSVTVDKTVKLAAADPNTPTCSVHLQLAEATEESGHRGELINEEVAKVLLSIEDTDGVVLNEAAKEFAERYTKSYVANMLPLYNQDRADTTRRAWYEYHYVITTETQPGSKGTVAYLATVDYYEGGAHGIHQLLTMNFEKKTGRRLMLADIFAIGYEQPLKEILIKALKTKEGVETLAALKEKGYLFAMDMFASENFILGPTTITFVYNPYEIAPYAMGSTQLVIPYSDIDKLLKTTFDY